MRANTYIFILFLMAFSLLHGQNLVPNYSFENKIRCVQHDDQFKGYVSNWAGLEPSYFTVCPGDTITEVPLSLYGFQYAHTGVSYAGIYTFGYSDTRDYIQDSLIQPLITGIKYYVTFYVSLANNYKYACNNIGAYLSDSSLNYSSQRVKPYLIPQITNNTTNLLTDTLNWMKITGEFKATGGEQYIVIGNFQDDAHSDTVFVNSKSGNPSYTWTEAYYFIDDVIVSPDSNYADSIMSVGIQNINEPKSEVRVWPNPSTGIFTIEEQGIINKRQIVEVYNVLGEKVISFSTTNTQFSIDLRFQPVGIYVYRIISDSGSLISIGKLIIK